MPGDTNWILKIKIEMREYFRFSFEIEYKAGFGLGFVADSKAGFGFGFDPNPAVYILSRSLLFFHHTIFNSVNYFPHQQLIVTAFSADQKKMTI